LNEHPGGGYSITLVAGEDATEDFMAIHSSDAKRQLSKYHIGTLADLTSLHKDDEEDEGDDDASKPFLNKKWKKATLLSVEDVSKDSKIFRFALQRPDQELGLPVGQHVYVRLKTKSGTTDRGEIVQRAYTPITGLDERGIVDLLVKFVLYSFIGQWCLNVLF